MYRRALASDHCFPRFMIRLEIRDFYVWRLVFLRLSVKRFLLLGVYFSYDWGFEILTLGG